MIEDGNDYRNHRIQQRHRGISQFCRRRTTAVQRSTESEAEFLAAFPVGDTVEAQGFAHEISTREDLFAALETMFSDQITDSSIIVISKKGKRLLVGTALNISGLAVFCAPGCEAPDGSDGRYFALGRGGQWEWLELTEENFGYVCGEIAHAINCSKNGDSFV